MRVQAAHAPGALLVQPAKGKAAKEQQRPEDKQAEQPELLRRVGKISSIAQSPTFCCAALLSLAAPQPYRRTSVPRPSARAR